MTGVISFEDRGAADCFEVLEIFLTAEEEDSRDLGRDFECVPKGVKTKGFFLGQDILKSHFKLVSSSREDSLGLSVRNPHGDRPKGHCSWVEGVSSLETWYERDDGAAKRGKGVNSASFRSA